MAVCARIPMKGPKIMLKTAFRAEHKYIIAVKIDIECAFRRYRGRQMPTERLR